MVGSAQFVVATISSWITPWQFRFKLNRANQTLTPFLIKQRQSVDIFIGVYESRNGSSIQFIDEFVGETSKWPSFSWGDANLDGNLTKPWCARMLCSIIFMNEFLLLGFLSYFFGWCWNTNQFPKWTYFLTCFTWLKSRQYSLINIFECLNRT